MQNDEELVPSGSGVLPDPYGTEPETIEDVFEETSEDESKETSEDESKETSEDESKEFQPHYENVGESYVTEPSQSSDIFVDYSGYFENLQTLDVLILGCLVAIGCILAWIGAKRE